MYWDLPGLWSHVRQGLAAARAAEGGADIVSMGIDTWGVDFGLLGRDDELLGNPYHYRDSRTNGMLERAFAIVPREEIFRHTGLQFMQFNTLYQLLAMKLAQSPLLDAAESLLFMPDLMHWLLTGVKCNEMTDRQHVAVLQSGEVRLGHGTVGQVRPARAYPGQDRAARHKARPLRAAVAAETRSAGARRPAGHPRYGQRRDGRPGAKQAWPAARLVLHQPGHLGPDGHRVAAAGDRRPGS